MKAETVYYIARFVRNLNYKCVAGWSHFLLSFWMWLPLNLLAPPSSYANLSPHLLSLHLLSRYEGCHTYIFSLTKLIKLDYMDWGHC